MLFCGSDIAKALGYQNVSKALCDHCKGVTKRYTPTTSGKQEMSFIPEGDLYRLIARSKLPAAEQFERWVFDEVTAGFVRSYQEQFPATDCAKVLGYARPADAIRDHCKGGAKLDTPSNGGIQKKNYIPEGDLYGLCST